MSATDHGGASVRLSYHKIRDVTTKDEELNGASTYVAVLAGTEIVKIGTEGNLRDYIPAHAGKKRNQVHKAIEKTIKQKADRFSQLNSGFLIGASKIIVDDNKKVITLVDASVNNGAQSQGEIKRYLDECAERGIEPTEFWVRCEVSVEPDVAMRTNIAVARNTATKIEGLSIAGKRGYFDELQAAFRKDHRKLDLALKETDVEDHFVDTRLLLQTLWALIPDELQLGNRRSIESRMRAYKNPAGCLQDYIKVYDKRKDTAEDAARYQYFLDMAGAGYTAYEHWRTHKDWNDKRLFERLGQAKRDADGMISDVSDAVVFPILSALSRFVKKRGDRWELIYPKVFEDDDMLVMARRQLKQAAGKPVLMGRSGAAYEGLMALTEMADRYVERSA